MRKSDPGSDKLWRDLARCDMRAFWMLMYDDITVEQVEIVINWVRMHRPDKFGAEHKWKVCGGSNDEG